MSDFILGGSKITADGDCSHEIKRRLLLGRKLMTNLDSIFKSRDITLPTKVHLVKALVFPVVMYGCESWTVKKTESRRIDAFELWCWRRLLRVPWTARRSNQFILKEINPGISLEGTEQFYEDLQDPLELTPKKVVLFIIGDWNAQVGSQETPGVTGKFGLRVQNTARQKLTEFCQENALVIADTLFQQQKRRLYKWKSPDGQL